MREAPLELWFARFRRDGDAKALAAVFDATAPELLRIARHLGGSRNTAEDLLQSTFLTAIERRDGFDTDRRLLPWLIGILANHAAAERRRQRRVLEPRPLAVTTPTEPPAALLDRELRDELERAIANLPPPYRELMASTLGGEARTAIAARVDREPGVVRMQISRGLRRLRHLLPAGLGAALLFWLGSRSALASVRRVIVSRGELLSGTVAAKSAATTGTIACGGILIVKKLALLLGATALLVVAGMFLTLSEPTPADDSLTASVPLDAPRAPGVTAAVERAAVVGTVAPADADSATDAQAEHAPPESYRRKLCGVRGRLLEHDGAPASDRPLTLLQLDPDEWTIALDHAFSGPPQATRIATAAAHTDAEGRFELFGVAQRGLHVLSVDPGGPRATLRVLAQSLTPGEVTDLGVIRLEPVIALRGRVVDEQAAPIAGARVRAIALPAPIAMLGVQHLQRSSVVMVWNQRRAAVLPLPAWAQDLLDRLPLPTTHTAADGTFVLAGAPPGLITTLIDHPAFVGTLVGPTPSGRSGERDLGILPLDPGRTLHGRVIDAEGEPVAGAQVAAGPVLAIHGVVIARATTTDADGRFAIARLPADGALQVAARATPIDAWTMPAADDVEQIDVRLASDVWLTLEVVDEQSNPLTAVEARLAPLNPLDRVAGYYFGYPTATLEPVPERSGSYRVGPLRHGWYSLLVRATDRAPVARDIEIDRDDPQVRIELPPGTTRVVRVIAAADGAAVEHALVSLSSTGEKSLALAHGRTDAGGRVTLGPIPIRDVTARVAHPGFPTVAVPLAQDAAEHEVVITLPLAGCVEGQLMSDAPVRDPYLVCIAPRQRTLDLDEIPFIASTDERGLFRVTNLAPGDYRIEIYPHLLNGDLMDTRLELLDGVQRLARRDLAIRSGETTRVEIPFLPPGAASACVIAGSVTRSGMPVADATVALRQERYQSTTTDAAGRFRFVDVAPGSITVQVRMPQPERAAARAFAGTLEQEFELAPGETREVTFDCESIEVSIGATHPGGTAVLTGKSVVVVGIDGAGRGSTASVALDAAGHARVTLAAAGRYRASLAANDVGRGSVEFDAPCPQPVELAVAAGVKCAGRIVSDGKIAASEQIMLGFAALGDDGKAAPSHTFSFLPRGDPRFDILGLQPGAYEFIIYLQDRAGQPVRVDLPEGGRTDLELKFVATDG